MKIFNNEVYERQRLNIEKLATEKPDNWFYKAQMEKPPLKRVGFAPQNRVCYNCKQDITKGENGISVKDIGDYIITGCPHCNESYCD